ncbi:Crocetin glucosyltransferase 3 [Camellia lanceoleosa]|uniref:Crocetin glucosyltransferase 3 n=1 Tax=Camellia lanceoleosa TaxID=1840588 RepID=A0ACC0G8F6_9ERIC|nr:Crocetin glucosyltransferase 3 [Camellia lanceoleosa]
MADAQQEEHIVMLPFMAHGHLIPFLALATQIHQTTGFTITIATTPLNIHYLRRSSTTANHRQIRLVALPFNSSDHGLPPNTENTEAVPLSQLITLIYASTTLEAPCHQLLADITAKDGRPPICIISDVVYGWATRVAQKVQTVNVSFTTCGAYGTATYVSLWQNLPHRRSPETDEYFSVPGFPNSCPFHRSQIHQFLRAADETSVGREEVKSVIDLVMEENGKKGQELKKNAVKIGELIKAALTEDEKGHKGSSLQAIDDFISAIVSAAESRRQ